MPKIETITLRSCDPLTQHRFYCDVLGMKSFADNTVGYGDHEARLSFTQAERPYAPTPQDLYWKIAIAVPNIELACLQLTERGISVDQPRQFQEIGYLAHFTDPEGFTIELIEHWFQGQRPVEEIDTSQLGGGAHLSLLTLRSGDIEQVMKACDDWSMKPLSIQPVESYDFTLYFYAFTEDVPPSSDLYAIENRPWLYQRPYTVLEIQHVHGPVDIKKPNERDAGYGGTELSDFSEDFQDQGLLIKAVGC